MSRRTLETLIALAAIVVLFYLLMVKVILVKQIQRPAPPRAFEPSLVETRLLEVGLETPSLQLSGSLAPRVRLAITAEVGGRVVRVLDDWHAGRQVEARELLFAIDPEPLKMAAATALARQGEAVAATAAAKIEVQAAKDLIPILAEAREVASREHARLSRLIDTGESSASMVDAALGALVQVRLAQQNGVAAYARAVAAVAVAEATAGSTQAAVEQAAEALLHVEFRAPFAGLLTADGPQLGTLLTPGGSLIPGASLGELVDPSALRLLAQAHESMLSRIVVGAPAEVELPSQPGVMLAARVERIVPLADPLTRNLTVELRVEQPSERVLPAGLFARARLAPTQMSEAQNRLFIKRGEFVWSASGRPVAFVATTTSSGAMASPRELRLGAAIGEGYVVLEGLSAGDRLITGPLDRLDPSAATPVTLRKP